MNEIELDYAKMRTEIAAMAMQGLIISNPLIAMSMKEYIVNEAESIDNITTNAVLFADTLIKKLKETKHE